MGDIDPQVNANLQNEELARRMREVAAGAIDTTESDTASISAEEEPAVVQHSGKGGFEKPVREFDKTSLNQAVANNDVRMPDSPADLHPNTDKKRRVPLWAKLTAGAAALGTAAGIYAATSGGGESHAPQGQGVTSSSPETPSSPAPASSQEASTPNASTTPTPSRLEQLETMAPLDNPVIASQPYGSAAVVERLYKNLQYADITGRTDMLEAAIGKANMTSDLGTQYEADVVAIQQHFQARPADRLTYHYAAKYVEQDSPDSPTYTLIASEQYAPGQKIESAQKIVLGTEQDPTTGAEHWIIAQVLEAVPVPPQT